jgi:hypothetical protein
MPPHMWDPLMIIGAIKNHWTTWNLSTTRRNRRRCHREEHSSSQENRAEKSRAEPCTEQSGVTQARRGWACSSTTRDVHREKAEEERKTSRGEEVAARRAGRKPRGTARGGADGHAGTSGRAGRERAYTPRRRGPRARRRRPPRAGAHTREQRPSRCPGGERARGRADEHDGGYAEQASMAAAMTERARRRLNLTLEPGL